MVEKILLNPADAADAMSLSVSFLRELKADGKIPYVPIGGAVRYDVADLRAFVEANKITNRTSAPADATVNSIA